MRVALNHLWVMTEERTPFLDRIYHFIMGLLECIPYFNGGILTLNHWLFSRAFSLNRKYLRNKNLEVSNSYFKTKLYLSHKGGFMSFDISCKDQKYFYKSTLSVATCDHVQITDEVEFQTNTCLLIAEQTFLKTSSTRSVKAVILPTLLAKLS